MFFGRAVCRDLSVERCDEWAGLIAGCWPPRLRPPLNGIYSFFFFLATPVPLFALVTAVNLQVSARRARARVGRATVVIRDSPREER